MKRRILSLILAMLLIFSIGVANNTEKTIKRLSKQQTQKKFKQVKTKEEKEKEKEIRKTARENEKNNKKEARIEKKKTDKFKEEMKAYELEAVIRTNKGNIKVFLYPEAAPVNVANFVYLAQNKFYDGLKFHRVIPNSIVQGGDPTGIGEGDAGYRVNDEIVDWLNFDSPGVFAMANRGPNTNGSQFFFTVSSLPQLDEKHTIIGGISSREDLSVIRVLREDDIILGVDILGKKVNTFLSHFSEEVQEWNTNYTGRK